MSAGDTCLTCGGAVPDLGPLKTPYRCGKCVRENRKLCGCWDENQAGIAFTFEAAKSMPERSAFTDNAHYLRHYCERHWADRGAP